MSVSSEAITELRRRLLEAEETLRAIREGEVDALVVGTSDSEQVFAIGGDAEAFRAFIDVMEPGAAALDSKGNILYANSHFAEIVERSLESLPGQALKGAFAPEVATKVAGLLDPGTKTSAEVTIGEGEGARHFQVSSKPLQLGTIRGFAITFADVTERVRAEQAEQSERVARAIIASANEAVLVCDVDGVITHANAAARVIYDGDPVGKRFAEIVPLTFPGATGIMETKDILDMAIAGTPVQGIEAVAPEAPKVHNFLVSAAPLQIIGDAVSGCVVTMVDLTQRKTAEQQQLLLMRELDHRVKNTLALVLSISSRTLHNEDTLDGYQKAFNGRIQALAATHNLLAENSWNDLTIQDVVLSELAPFSGFDQSRIVMDGLDVAILPRAAIAFGLIVHELTTNAVKYGALSVAGGAVSVRARPGEGESQALIVEWRESGGPKVVPPTKSGFGHTVISRSMRYLPEGHAEIGFEPTGVVCTISIPGEDLRRKAA